MKVVGVCIFLGCAILVNCLGGQESVFLAIENYQSNSGKEIRAQCIKESGVPEEYVIEVEQTGALTKPDKRMNCYIRCNYLKSNVIDEKGVLNVDVLQSLLNATSTTFLEKVETKCKQPTKPDLCDSAYDLCVCILSTAHEEHILED